jgi:hypothetical protein
MDNIKMDGKEMWCSNVDSTYLAENRDYLRAVLKTYMKHRIP